MADEFTGKGLPLDGDGLQQALATVSIGAAELWAVLGVETTGCGFLADKRPKVLFERHVFSKESQGRFDGSHPDLSNAKPGGYAPTGVAEYERLKRALQLDRGAALRSTSWGIGQVMGFNAGVTGYADVAAMVAAMTASESAQLGAMTEFIKAEELDGVLGAHDWPTFARLYNGPAYALNSYDTRLAAAYQRYLHGALPDLTVRAAQVFLLYLGYQPGAIDGMMGRFTRSAMNAFQSSAGLAVTELLDDGTYQALQQAAVGA